MSDEIRVEELERLTRRFTRAPELPERFIAKVEGVGLQPDSTGRKCLYFWLTLRDGSETVIKYTPLHIADVAEFLRKLGLKTVNELVGKEVVFIKRHYRIGYPRPIPTELIRKASPAEEEEGRT